MDNSKKWYKSKTIWSILLNAAVGVIQAVNPDVLGTPVATSLITILSVFGIYSRTSADTKINK